MQQAEEKDIIERILRGERNAYAQLVDAYSKPIYNLAWRLTGSKQDADDLAQETFIRAYEYLYRFDQNRKFFTWLYTICLNLSRNRLNKAKREGRVHGPDNTFFANPEETAGGACSAHSGESDGAQERMEDLERAMGQLNADQREVLILKFYSGLSFEEIADILNLSVSAVKMRAYRGLDKLKQGMSS